MRARLTVVLIVFVTAIAGCADADSGDTDFGVSRSTTTTADGESTSTTDDEGDDERTTTTARRSTTSTMRRGSTASTTTRPAPTTTAAPPASTTTAPAPPVTQAPRSATISINNYQFVPAQLSVPLNSRVTVVNNDGVDHSWVGDSGAWHSSNLAPNGGSFTQLFNRRGHFPYHCEYHPGMRGTVTVT